jgi:thymidine kinase
MLRNGYLEVIAGPMFCGKTEELIRQVKRATIGKKKVQVFKPHIDIRYGKNKKVFSHNGITFDSEIIASAEEIMKNIHKYTEIIAIDEAQWLGNDLTGIVLKLLDQGKHVIVAGLAMTFDREPFEPIPALMSMADKVTKLSAVCTICGADAVYHKRITKSNKVDSQIADPSFVGKIESYQARCRKCFNKKP